MKGLHRKALFFARKMGRPHYDCEQCVGQEWWRGCYCDYHGCVAPCVEATRWHRFWRWVEEILRRSR